jgi:hypothetical protein
MSLLRQGKAQALTIYLGESDQWQGTPLYVSVELHFTALRYNSMLTRNFLNQTV